MIVALIALFVALGGVAGAATTLVTTSMLKNNSVTRAKIAPNAVDSSKIKNRSIQLRDLSSSVLRGVKGAQGEKGDRGATGTNGTNGTDGKTILSGSSDPTSGTGNNGDFYINTSSNTLFGPKASGAWPGGTSLVGPSGTTGAAGPSDIYWDTFEVENVEEGSTTLGTFSLPAGSWLIAATFFQDGGGTSQTATGSLVRESDSSTLASEFYFSRGEHLYVHLMYGATLASTTNLSLLMAGSGSTSNVTRSVNVMAIKTGNLTTS